MLPVCFFLFIFFFISILPFLLFFYLCFTFAFTARFFFLFLLHGTFYYRFFHSLLSWAKRSCIRNYVYVAVLMISWTEMFITDLLCGNDYSHAKLLLFYFFAIILIHLYTYRHSFVQIFINTSISYRTYSSHKIQDHEYIVRSKEWSTFPSLNHQIQ